MSETPEQLEARLRALHAEHAAEAERAAGQAEQRRRGLQDAVAAHTRSGIAIPAGAAEAAQHTDASRAARLAAERREVDAAIRRSRPHLFVDRFTGQPLPSPMRRS